MGRFRFTTHWTFDVPVRRLWVALIDPLGVAAGWANVTVEASRDARPLRKDASIDWRIRSPLRTTLRVTTRVVELATHRTIHIEASGHLAGWGMCRIAPADGGSRVDFEWDVDAMHRGMTVVAALPGGRRILRWAHDRVMAAARDALTRVLAHPEPSLKGL